MKRIFGLLLTVILLVALLSGCDDGTLTRQAHVEGAIFGGKTDDSIAVPVVFNIDWITEGDNKVYNPDLAAFASLLSADSYYREKDMAKGRQNRVLLDDAAGDYDFTSLLQNVGFKYTLHVESIEDWQPSTDRSDTVTMTIGYLETPHHDAYVIVFRGCFSSDDWLSTFDPGGGEAYEQLTGSHNQWTNRDRFKGLDVTANRAIEYIRDFMKEHNDTVKTNCFLVTGHSRGGSLANIVGAELEQSGRTYVYTFNSMPVALGADEEEHPSIFNIFDSNDFFTDPLPFANERFSRYGTDMGTDIGASVELRSTLAQMKGRYDYSCVSRKTKEEYDRLFAEQFPDRSSLYVTESRTETYDTREEAEARRAELASMVGSEEGLCLDPLCSVGEVISTEDGKFSVTLAFCPAAKIRGFSRVLAYGESAYNTFCSLFAFDEAALQTAALLYENLASVSGGHLLANSYLLTKYLTE